MKKLALALAAMLVSASAQAAVVYQSIDLDNVPSTAGNGGVYSGLNGAYRGFSDFTLDEAATVSQADFLVNYGYGYDGGAIEVGIYAVDATGGHSLVAQAIFDAASRTETQVLSSVKRITVALPDVQLNAGHYEFSYFSPNQLVLPLFARTGNYYVASGGGGYFADESSAFRLSSADAPAVPEPATWAMMLGGLGVLGVATRRRTSAARVLA